MLECKYTCRISDQKYLIPLQIIWIKRIILKHASKELDAKFYAALSKLRIMASCDSFRTLKYIFGFHKIYGIS
jgi:hypothetical protein